MNIQNLLRIACTPKNQLLVMLLLLSTALFGQIKISGTIKTAATLEPVSVVPVSLTGTTAQVTVTDANGYYEFIVPAGGTYNVRPYCSGEPLNGVSTYDQVLLVKNFLGVSLFTSPYELIAADVDGSQSINPGDTSIVRPLLLLINTNFPGDVSWRFVPQNYVFPDPLQPFPYPQSSTFVNLNADVSTADFLGIKVGDINGTAIPVGGISAATTYTALLSGALRMDENNNCLVDTAELALADWVVYASDGNDSYYALTNNAGYYSIPVPAGAYTVHAVPVNNLWTLCTPLVNSATLGQTGTATIDFSASPVVQCPRMEVGLSAPFLRRCFSTSYQVNYCNSGTAIADNASVSIDFDPLLTVLSSTIPWSTVNGNTYTFPLGNVAIGARSAFQVQVSVSCDAVLGQTHCSTATITPSPLCAPTNPLWNGANLEVSAACQNGEVVFTVTNTGLDMTEAIHYVVIEDIMVEMAGGTLQLNNGATEQITVPANGATWRLEAEQPAGHPDGTVASAAVEGCGVNENGTISLGFINQFPLDDAEGYVDVDCQPNIGSFDPNDKYGLPLGTGAEHAIRQGQNLDYVIRFQNTGTDTAFQIIVRDTLPETLDVRTLQLLGTSHPCVFSLLGNGVAQWLFPQIMLPDSNTNEAASHGYLKFSIAQQPDLPEGTEIRNRAGIYFDFNAPVLTDYSLHTVKAAVTGISTQILQGSLGLEVFPNPTTVQASFVLKSAAILQGYIHFYNMQGQEVLHQHFDHNVFTVPTDWMESGMYHFRIESDGRQIAYGKMIVGK